MIKNYKNLVIIKLIDGMPQIPQLLLRNDPVIDCLTDYWYSSDYFRNDCNALGMNSEYNTVE